jgi:pre-rRNA-processing protein IPI1
VERFKHYLSLAATSRSDTQRREALAYLTGQLSVSPPYNPVGTFQVLNRLLPLVSDSSALVRNQLLKLLRVLPAQDVRSVVDKAVLYVRAGMSNLSAEVREDAMNVMEWLLDTAGKEVAECPGGWMKMLGSFCGELGWKAEATPPVIASTHTASKAKPASGWTEGRSNTLVPGRSGETMARQMMLLGKFLSIGFVAEERPSWDPNAYWRSIYSAPQERDPFGYLNLFGLPRDEEGEAYTDREDRQRVFYHKWNAAVAKGVEEARKQGGAVGRAAVALNNVLKDGMKEFYRADS